MQRPSLLSSSTPPVPTLPNRLHFETLFPKHLKSYSNIPSWTKLHLNCSHFAQHTLSPIHTTAIEAVVETIPDESEFIEIGYISKVHGLKGELRVKPSTDFPELRFSKPGRRWLRMRVLGKETIQEVELTEGRGQPGQKTWILSFSGIDNVDKAKQFVGSTILVRESERPVLEEGQFYIPDLVGMRVFLKETGKLVGTVVNVFNFGANDLLQVMVHSEEERLDQSGLLKSETAASGLLKSETATSGRLVWVPFVEAIVPDVDMKTREMQITPPKGLLELNLRSDDRSKKERRQLEWKERKKYQKRLIAAKKKLCEMGQQHVLQGFSFGEKAQKSLLANQIVGINFKLLQQAIHNINMPSPRCNLTEFIDSNPKLLKNALRISKECLTHYGSKKNPDINRELHERGFNLMSKGKLAVILVKDDNKDQGSGHETHVVGSESVDNPSNASHLLALFLDDKKFSEEDEWCYSVPLVMISPAHEIQSSQQFFSDHDYFGFNGEKVWFLEEEKLPVFSSSLTEQNRHQILLKSPWKILQSPVGSGGVISLLSSHDILENLNEMGVEYVEVRSLGHISAIGNPLFLGFIDSREADIGIKILEDEERDYKFDMIFSMRFLKKITKQINKLEFYTVLKQNSHVEKVDKEWVDIHATSPNSAVGWEGHVQQYLHSRPKP
ncbi:16S rRNA processing protein RimM family isoform X2 [Tasmannia lanceolata]|uniref:16S rRNA processing protein RimM family isoform X2 n=1 Tax=Tasmannia lanceolata TaxID=3420 RepID=UPI004062E019